MPPHPQPSAWAVFQNRDFALFSFSRLLASNASQMEVVAVSWLVYELTHSAFALGLVGLSGFLPAFGLALVTGDVADRFDRRLIIMTSYTVRFFVMLGLLACTLLRVHQVWIIYLLVFGTGASRAFVMPASQALIPNLVPREQFAQAVAWNSSIFQTATIIGPALGGFLYALGAPVVFGLGAVCLAATVAMMALMTPERRTRAPIAGAGQERVLAGLRFIWSRPPILGSISLDLFAVLLGGATALMPVYAKDILHVGPWGLGLMRSMPAVGALTVALLLAHRPILRGAGRRMFGAVAVFGLATIGFGLSTNLYLSLICLVFLGAADMISVVIRQTLVQISTPDDMRGRVAAVNSVFIGASNELGEFESGTTAALFGTVPAVVIGGLGTLAVAWAWTRLFPELWRHESLAE